MSRDLHAILADVRGHSEGLRRGNRDSFSHWKRLANLLLHLTVAPANQGVGLTSWAEDERKADLVGFGRHPLRLRNGKYLWVYQTLAILDDPAGKGPRLKVVSAGYQYQRDRDGDQWLFRFDYLRIPPAPHPGAHVQVRAEPLEPGLVPEGRTLERIHFPTRRISLEAVIRLLIEDFGIRPAVPAAIWRPVLMESERLFRSIAHEPAAGPDV